MHFAHPISFSWGGEEPLTTSACTSASDRGEKSSALAAPTPPHASANGAQKGQASSEKAEKMPGSTKPAKSSEAQQRPEQQQKAKKSDVANQKKETGQGTCLLLINQCRGSVVRC